MHTISMDFPFQEFFAATNTLLNKLEYKDVNYEREQRVSLLRHTYSAGAQHFRDCNAAHTLQITELQLHRTLQTVTRMVVYCWVNLDKVTMSAVTIYFTYMALLDDIPHLDRSSEDAIAADLMSRGEKRDPWRALVDQHIDEVVRHYPPFAGAAIFVSKQSFELACYVERNHPESMQRFCDGPEFWRDKNGLGMAVGATLWPKSYHTEVDMDTIIATWPVIAIWMTKVNDLLSFYKENCDVGDTTYFLANDCRRRGVTPAAAVADLSREILSRTNELLAVSNINARIGRPIKGFMIGFSTWQMCDDRYRMSTVSNQAPFHPDGAEFTKYFQSAHEAHIPADEWTQ